MAIRAVLSASPNLPDHIPRQRSAMLLASEDGDGLGVRARAGDLLPGQGVEYGVGHEVGGCGMGIQWVIVLK